ncbi:DUF1302 family protein [Halonatronum saccharophilum]|uniref:DUF1302 family protein n=1 Tax=Halonatronum saccharophilum TaxID=150060 RepID=UPI000489A81F|nr:DUF1302 family protein [Halonatronum saccharophilum]
MKKFNLLTLTLVLILSLSITVSATELSGSLEQYIEVDIDEEIVDSQNKFNLIVEEEFGFDGDMYVDLEFVTDGNYNHRFRINEAYLEYYTMNMDWKLGKQVVNWGSAFKVNPTNYFNPQNSSSSTPLDDKLGVRAVKGTYYTMGGAELTGVISPTFKGLDSPIEGIEVNKVSDRIKDMQVGVKATKRGFNGYDLSLSLYNGFDKIPSVSEIDEHGNPTELEYPEVTKIGFDLIGDINDIGIWSEIVYNIYGEDYCDDNFTIALGADYNFDNDLYLVGQFFYNQERSDFDNDIKALNLHLEKPVMTFHEIEFTALYDLESESYSINPQYNHSLTDSVELQLGGRLVELKDEGLSSLIGSGADSLYARLQLDF